MIFFNFVLLLQQMESDIYKTLAKQSEGLFKDKGSKFIGFAYPVSTEDEIKEILSKIKKQYHDATHYCWAYRLGFENETWRVNDDGEPSGSAGRPIYGQILSKELTNVFVVVVRYYGGVKLGVSGLINAYRTAAAEALENGQIIEKTIDFTVDVKFDYNAMNPVMKIIKDENIRQLNHNFDLYCSIRLVIRKRDLERILALLAKINNVETTTI